jgi:putative aldouronate transport system substrate-binding protein
MVQPNLDRRHFLQFSGLAALAVATPIVLAACSSGSAATGGGSGAAAEGSGAAAGSVLPKYIPYEGVTADLPGSKNYMAAFYRVPDSLPAAFKKPPVSGGSVSMMTNIFAPPPPSVDSNSYWRALNKAIGADLDINMVPDSDYATKTSAVLAGGDLPDVVNLPLYTPRLGEVLPALFADLAPYLGGDKSEDYPYLANIPTDSWRPLVYDGHLFGVPTPRMSTGTVMFKRADILKKLGLETDPKTWDDFVALSKELTSDADKRWAMDDPHRLHTFALASLGAPNTWKVSKNGDFVSVLATDAYMDALDKTRDFIKKGYLHPDGFSATFDQTRTNYGTGACVFHSDGYLAWETIGDPYPGIEVDALRPLITSDGKAYQFTSAGALSLSAVKKGDEKGIRRALSTLNWLAAPFGTKEYMLRKFGVEGKHYTMTNGLPQRTDLGNSEAALPLQYIVDSAPVIGPGAKAEIDTEYAYHKAVGAELLEDPSIGLYSDTYAKKGGTVAKIMSDAVTEILLGHRSVSSWPGVVTQWKAAGGAAIAKEYAKAYADSKA